jgi:hypothetical protein
MSESRVAPPAHLILLRLVDMYTQWLDEDQKDLEITEEDIKELKKELSDVKNKISAKSNVLSAQEETLNDKDERLHVWHTCLHGNPSDFCAGMRTMLSSTRATTTGSTMRPGIKPLILSVSFVLLPTCMNREPIHTHHMATTI